jgi:hypothetical protein
MWFLISGGILLLICLVAMFIAFIERREAGGTGAALTAVITGVLFVIDLVLSSFVWASPGEAQVGILFGSVQPTIYINGLTSANPLLSTVSMNIRRQTLDFSDKSRIEAVSSDQVQLLVEVVLPFALNPSMAWKVYERLGSEATGWNLLSPAATSAVRYCVTGLTWVAAVGAEGRDQLASCLTTRLPLQIANDLQGIGFTTEQAKQAFVFSPPQVKHIVPKSERILAAVNDKEAALQDLQRQNTLTEIAKVEANRRENQGLGIAKMMDALPKSFSVDEMVKVINANANQHRAEALEKAVQSGNPNVTFIVGGNGNVAVPSVRGPQAPAPSPVPAK